MLPRRSSTRRTQERKFFRSHFSRREGHSPGGNFFAKIQKKLLTIPQSAGIITPVVRHGTNIWGISSAGRALAWHARGHRFDPGILHQKSTVLRRKYGAFLFAEAGFWGLHCFACTVFRLLQAVPIQPPTFDFTPFSKRNVCSPVFQQAAASSPLNRRSKRRRFPTIREATAFVDYRMSQP